MLTLLLACALATAGVPNYLTDRELRIIERNMPHYRQAAGMAGIPVLALPAIHKLESDLRDAAASSDPWKTTNIGGPMMMDEGGDGTDYFDVRIRSRELSIAAKYCIAPAPRVRDDLPFALLCAADHLREKARGRFWTRRGKIDIEVLADAFWGYNGRAYGSWRKSPYVWNHPKRGRKMPMRFRVRGDIVEQVCERPGALVLYYELERRLRDE